MYGCTMSKRSGRRVREGTLEYTASVYQALYEQTVRGRGARPRLGILGVQVEGVQRDVTLHNQRSHTGQEGTTY